MAKTYLNLPDDNEISLGIERILIAPENTSWTPARVDIGSPPSGFFDLGAVVEDSPKLSLKREYFEIEAGIPPVVKFRKIRTVSGQFSVSLHSKSLKRWAYSFGIEVTTAGISVTSISTMQDFMFTVTDPAKYSLLGVIDFLDQTQLVHYFPRVSPSDESLYEIQATQNPRIPLTFEALTVPTTISTCVEELCFHTFEFTAIDTLCVGP